MGVFFVQNMRNEKETPSSFEHDDGSTKLLLSARHAYHVV